MRIKKQLLLTFVLGLVFLWTSSDAIAAPTGAEIVKSAFSNHSGYVGQRIAATLTTIDKHGDASKASLTIMFREAENEGDGMRSLLRFTSPKTLAGSGILTHELVGNNDKRWLYLANTKTLKRISATTTETTILGSEFTFEDLAFMVLADFDYKFMGEKNIDGRACWEVELTPKSSASQYGRLLSCFDKERKVNLRSQMFARSGEQSKIIKFGDYRQHKGKWRAHTIRAENSHTKRSSELKVIRLKLGLKFAPSIFTVAQLRMQ